jgi:hypothetical protein
MHHAVPPHAAAFGKPNELLALFFVVGVSEVEADESAA